MKNLVGFVLGSVLLQLNLLAVVPSNDKTRIHDDWQYIRGDLGGIWEAIRPETTDKVPIWKRVTLPHCFNRYDAVDPEKNYYQGSGWYKSLLKIKNPYKNGRIILDFEGAGQKTELYIYDTKVASHVGGYDEWSVDITDAVKAFLASPTAKEERFMGKVPVSVRCDNTRDIEMIPSDLSDFNLYGGIYRNLHLVYVPEISFENIEVKAQVDAEGALGQLSIDADFYHPQASTEGAKVQLSIKDPQGKELINKTVKLDELKPEESLCSIDIKNPQLWDTDNPLLYSCRLSLASKDGSVTTDEKFGFRHIEFVKHGPFKLNGKRLFLRGTHRHEDHAGLAAALSDQIMRDEMQMMKDMGVNFIRLGHYQQSELILDLCDELGILVWEEIPWCRGGVGGPVYQAQAHRMLTNMIQQHRNHPSIILWGMGNENDWPNDFEVIKKDDIRSLMRSLNDLSHTLDPSRSTCIRRCDYARDLVDVYSFSVWPGWYVGRYTDYYNAMYYAHHQTDRFLHVEWGGDSHAGRFSENPYKLIDKPDYKVKRTGQVDGARFKYTHRIKSTLGDWSESYICDLFDWCLKEQEDMPWLSGAANWTFKDFSTPLRPENPVPYVNQKGLLERDGTPKESYYVFQSYWAKKPMVRVFGHKWYVRWGAKGEAKQIRVYSNCPRVELFLNGQSQGVKTRNSKDFPAAGLHWDCVMQEGANTIKAIAYTGGEKENLCDEITQEYQSATWGKEATIDAQVIERGNGYVWVECMFKDAKGVRCLDSRKQYTFDYAGDGKMICDMGTSTASRMVGAMNGRARIKIEIPRGGVGALSIKAKGLKSVILNIK